MRLDRFLAGKLPECSGHQARQLVEAGLVMVNGRRVRAGYRLNCGDVVEAIDRRPRVRPELVWAQGGPETLIDILFEDEHLLVIEKRRGMHSIVQRIEDELTVADAVAAHVGGIAAGCEAGLIHRLDLFTSGVMVAAKSDEVRTHLRAQLSSEEMEKSYVVLVEGVVPLRDRVVSLPLQSVAGGRKMAVASAGQPARTKFRLLAQREDSGLVLATVASARRHQIRAHLAAIGHPLIGDELYGAGTALGDLPRLRSIFARPEGYFLNAESVCFEHPVTGRTIECRSRGSEAQAVYAEYGYERDR